MTSKEILTKRLRVGHLSGDSSGKAIMDAMEQYAKLFASYISEFGWTPYEKNKWEHPDDSTASTDTLYDEFERYNLYGKICKCGHPHADHTFNATEKEAKHCDVLHCYCKQFIEK